MQRAYRTSTENEVLQLQLHILNGQTIDVSNGLCEWILERKEVTEKWETL